MKPILLPLSALREHRARGLDERIEAFTEKHGAAPTETTTLREWLEVTPDMSDWLWATQCLGRAGRILGLEVATKAARRALAAVGWDHGADPRLLRAFEAAEEILAALWAGREPVAEMRRAAYAANASSYVAYASTAAYAANAAAYAYDAAAYAADADDADRRERVTQRADFMAALDRIECARGAK